MAGQIDVKVSPRSSQNKVEVREGVVRVWVTASPTDGQANEAVIRLIADRVGCAPSRVEIVRGHSSREKRLEFTDLSADEVFARLGR